MDQSPSLHWGAQMTIVVWFCLERRIEYRYPHVPSRKLLYCKVKHRLRLR